MAEEVKKKLPRKRRRLKRHRKSKFAKHLCVTCGVREKYYHGNCIVCERERNIPKFQRWYAKKKNRDSHVAKQRIRDLRAKALAKDLAARNIVPGEKSVTCRACTKVAAVELSNQGYWLCRVCRRDFDSRGPNEGPQIRKRGRPKKVLTEAEAALAKPEAPYGPQLPRKRGRPKKVA